MIIQLSAVHIKSGKVINKRFRCKNLSVVLITLAQKGWIVNRLVTII
jgi:hypothetical protein